VRQEVIVADTMVDGVGGSTVQEVQVWVAGASRRRRCSDAA